MSLSFSIRDQSDMRHDKAANIIEHKGEIVQDPQNVKCKNVAIAKDIQAILKKTLTIGSCGQLINCLKKLLLLSPS